MVPTKAPDGSQQFQLIVTDDNKKCQKNIVIKKDIHEDDEDDMEIDVEGGICDSDISQREQVIFYSLFCL